MNATIGCTARQSRLRLPQQTRRITNVYLELTATPIDPAESARDLGFVLHKHPDRVHTSNLSFGTATVFFPAATDESCTVALLVDVDPAAPIIRDIGERTLGRYVNDRGYAASSLLAVALSKVFRSAMNGSAERSELATAARRLTVTVPTVATTPELVERMFAPLGWDVSATAAPLDPEVPQWGDGPYVSITLSGTTPVQIALNQLYVLLPILGGRKHYWVGDAEVSKLLRAGAGWLESHPDQAEITGRYLRFQRSLVDPAMAQLAELDSAGSPSGRDESVVDVVAEAAPRRVSLAQQRGRVVVEKLQALGAARIIDVGCGEGALERELLALAQFTHILGTDVSSSALKRAAERLGLSTMSERQAARIELRQSSVTYRDDALNGFDAAVLMEVIEHVDVDRLPSLEQNIFGHAAPTAVIVTTPNADYNVNYPFLGDGMRHTDHRFEWTRAEFAAWTADVAERFGYAVEHFGVTPPDADELPEGPPTQGAVFAKTTGSAPPPEFPAQAPELASRSKDDE